MPVVVEAMSEAKFQTQEEMKHWVDGTQEHLRRVPTEGFLSSGARFHDDEYFGDGETMVRFNEHGFRTFCQKVGYPEQCTETEKRRIKLEHDARVMRLLPKHFGGEHSNGVFQSHWRDSATMFDFLNVFTEHAKGCPVSQQLEIESKTGTLAKYTAENARKF